MQTDIDLEESQGSGGKDRELGIIAVAAPTVIAAIAAAVTLLLLTLLSSLIMRLMATGIMHM